LPSTSAGRSIATLAADGAANGAADGAADPVGAADIVALGVTVGGGDVVALAVVTGARGASPNSSGLK
jgi:hypothetical protein